MLSAHIPNLTAGVISTLSLSPSPLPASLSLTHSHTRTQIHSRHYTHLSLGDWACFVVYLSDSQP